LNDLKLNSFVFHGRPSQCEEAGKLLSERISKRGYDASRQEACKRG
jgi:hypothetical protein